MRVGSTIIMESGVCYQSYEWCVKRPLGSIGTVLKFLDEYEVDEICLIRPVRDSDSDQLFHDDLKAVRESVSNTPISFGGGLRNIERLDSLKNLPIERFHFSNAFLRGHMDVVDRCIEMFGRQAVVAVLPLSLWNNDLYVYDGIYSKFSPLRKDTIDLVMEHADEILVVDTQNEGVNDRFDFSLLARLQIPHEKLIISGGVGVKTIAQARARKIASCLVDNRVLHRENYIKSEIP